MSMFLLQNPRAGGWINRSEGGHGISHCSVFTFSFCQKPHAYVSLATLLCLSQGSLLSPRPDPSSGTWGRYQVFSGASVAFTYKLTAWTQSLCSCFFHGGWRQSSDSPDYCLLSPVQCLTPWMSLRDVWRTEALDKMVVPWWRSVWIPILQEVIPGTPFLSLDSVSFTLLSSSCEFTYFINTYWKPRLDQVLH